MRNVTHNFDSDQFTKIALDTDHQKVLAAIGYLSTWNPNTYPIVNIMIDDRNREITAVYRNGDDHAPGYVIAAVWHDEHFGFHS